MSAPSTMPSADASDSTAGRPLFSSREWLALEASLLQEAPRVVVDPAGRIWADVAGLDERRAAAGLRHRLQDAGWAEVGVGVADVPVAAELAARLSGEPFFVRSGREREWLAPLRLERLEPEPSLLALLHGVGIERCGALAGLEREAVEVRFGPEGVALWRLARGQDPRLLFGRPAPERPHASLDFVDYVVTDPERLLFTANALLGPVCSAMERRGLHARRLLMRLELADGSSWQRSLRAARPTASRARWRGLIRSRLERLTVPDAVAGMRLEVQSTEEATARQGDLFDRGFATAGAVEAALVRLMDEQGPVMVRPDVAAHPLAERRVEWQAADDVEGAEAGGSGKGEPAGHGHDTTQTPAITLQLLPEPRRLRVETVPRRDHEAPTRLWLERGGAALPFESGAWLELLAAAGPQRISGGHWEGGYAREYFRCITTAGVPLWVFRDPFGGGWFLHGWLD